MQVFHNAQSDTRPQTLEINIDTVYRRSNIHTIEHDEQTMYEFDEIQYSIQEYLRDIVPQLELAIAELSGLIGGGLNV